MSRHLIRKQDITIAYGFDSMMPTGGYFFQVFDQKKVSDSNEEGLVVNEGFFKGIGKSRMADLMIEWELDKHPIANAHLVQVALDLPI